MREIIYCLALMFVILACQNEEVEIKNQIEVSTEIDEKDLEDLIIEYRDSLGNIIRDTIPVDKDELIKAKQKLSKKKANSSDDYNYLKSLEGMPVQIHYNNAYLYPLANDGNASNSHCAFTKILTQDQINMGMYSCIIQESRYYKGYYTIYFENNVYLYRDNVSVYGVRNISGNMDTNKNAIFNFNELNDYGFYTIGSSMMTNKVFTRIGNRLETIVGFADVSPFDSNKWKISPSGEVELKKIQFYMDNTSLEIQRPDLYQELTLSNGSEILQEMSMNYTKKVVESSSFSTTESNSFNIKGGISVNIDNVVSVNTERTYSSTNSWTYGTGQQKEDSRSFNFSFKVPSGRTLTGIITIGSTEISANYIATYVRVLNGQEFKIKGKWKGIIAGKVDYRIFDNKGNKASFARPSDNSTIDWEELIKINLTIKTLTGKSIYIRIDPDATIHQVMEKIREKEGIPPEQQRLLNPKLGQLNPSKTLKEYGIVDGTLLHLVLRL